MALKDEALEYIQEQFEEKNMVLAGFGEQVSAATLYEDIFEDLDTEVPVVIIDEDEEKKIQKMTVGDALAFSACRNDVLLGGSTYFNNYISKRTAKDVHALIIDMDNVYSGTLQNALQRDWRSGNDEVFAKPTYIVNSGTGLHLYFVFDEPVPVFADSRENLDKVYRALAVQQSRRVYVNKQVQWFGQDFRMAGGLNKYEWENTVFRIGEKWDIDELAKAVGIEAHFIRRGEPRQKKPAERKKKRNARQGWKVNRAFYDCALRNCTEKTKEGNRYMSMCALSVIAWKCGVPQEELERDLLSLLPGYNKGATRKVREREVYSAMKMYNSKAMLTQRETLEHWQGWEYTPVKRNGRRRNVHLMGARAIQEINDRVNGTNWREGNGRLSKKDIIKQWRKENPYKSKTECSRELGISRPTVYKWWDN